MKAPWDLAKLRSLIRDLESERHYLLDTVDSIARATDIFRYHLFKARDALNGFVDKNDPASLDALKLVLGVSEKTDEFAYARLASEANIVGCIHTARSMFDIFGQLVNGLLVCPPIPVERCDIRKVGESMPNSDLKMKISKLLLSHWFNYVSGFINTTKHRRLVQHRYSISFEENIAGIKIGAFSYNGHEYPQYWGSEVLNGVLDFKNSVIDCGRGLNEICMTGD